jgi:hypothetical protein
MISDEISSRSDIAVLDNFSCGSLVILISNCGVAVFSNTAGSGLEGDSQYKNLSFTFSNHFRVSGRFAIGSKVKALFRHTNCNVT